MRSMSPIAHSKLTAQGQVSVPAAVRRRLGVGPGAVLEWAEDGYALGPAAIARAVEMLLNHEHLTVQDTEVVAAALEAYRGNARLAFSDCLVLEIARKAGHLPVGTVDRRLAKLAGAQKLQVAR